MKALLKKAKMIQDKGHWSDPMMYPAAVRDSQEMRLEAVYGNILPTMSEVGGLALGALGGYYAAKGLDQKTMIGTMFGGAAMGGLAAAKIGGPAFDYLKRSKIQNHRRLQGTPIVDRRDVDMYLVGKVKLPLSKGSVSNSAQRLKDNNWVATNTTTIPLSF
jgi:hypothetical protein